MRYLEDYHPTIFAALFLRNHVHDGVRDLKPFESKLQLLDLTLDLFRAGAELLFFQARDLDAQRLDDKRMCAQLCLQREHQSL